MSTSGRHLCSIFITASALLLAGCSAAEFDNTAGMDNTKGAPLRFSVESNAMRATADTETLREFSVWATYRPTVSASSAPWVPVFGNSNQATVQKTDAGKWSYGDELYYWYPGNTYSFQAMAVAAGEGAAAVTPQFNTAANNESHYLSVGNFDGTQGTDLLYAVAARDYADVTSPSVVSFDFSHLTARITITGLIDPILPENHVVNISSVKLYGMNSQGSWSGSNFNPAAGNYGRWDVTQPATAGAPYAINTNSQTIKKSSTATDLFSTAIGASIDIMMLPQNIPTNSVVEIQYYNNNETETPHTVRLNLWSVSAQIGHQWQAGKSYRYNVTFGGSDYIIFDAPQVQEWVDEEGGNIIIQKPSGVTADPRAENMAVSTPAF